MYTSYSSQFIKYIAHTKITTKSSTGTICSICSLPNNSGESRSREKAYRRRPPEKTETFISNVRTSHTHTATLMPDIIVATQTQSAIIHKIMCVHKVVHCWLICLRRTRMFEIGFMPKRNESVKWARNVSAPKPCPAIRCLLLTSRD